jgi:hypothetical protein
MGTVGRPTGKMLCGALLGLAGRGHLSPENAVERFMEGPLEIREYFHTLFHSFTFVVLDDKGIER